MSETQPSVSVIIAFLNEENYLEEAVLSVMQQEYNNWELILVDDGSSDSSTAIAKSFAKQDANKIFYLEHAGHINKGLMLNFLAIFKYKSQSSQEGNKISY